MTVVHGSGLRRLVLVGTSLVLLAACSGASGGPQVSTATSVAATSDAGGPSPSSGGDAGPSGGKPKPDPCVVLTPDDLKTVIGVPFRPGTLDPISTASGLTLTTYSHCLWLPQDATDFRSVTFAVRWVNAATTDDYELYRSQGGKDLSGIGEKAWVTLKEAGNDSELRFKQGDLYGSVNAGGATWAPTQEQLTKLAQTALSRF